MNVGFEEPLEWWVDGTPDSVGNILRRAAEDLREPGLAYSITTDKHRSGVPTLTVRAAKGKAGSGPIGQIQLVVIPEGRVSLRIPKGRGSLNPNAWTTDQEGTLFTAFIDAAVAELARSGFNPQTPGARQVDVPLVAIWPHIAQGLSRLKNNHPAVHSKIDLAHARLLKASSSEDCQAVGLLCRDALIMLGNEIFSTDFVPDGREVPKDHAKSRIGLALEHFGGSAGTEEERKLVRSVVEYTMRVHHNRESTMEGARKAVLYATLALIEVASLVETASASEKLVQDWGVYKCGRCGSTDLEEDLDVGTDSDGMQSPTFFLTCSKCSWGLTKGSIGKPMQR